MYAIINDRGNQLRVQEGETIQIDRVELESGKPIEFTDVLLYANGEDIRIGRPNVPNVKVVGEIAGEQKGDKIRIVKYRRREMYQKHAGHRQKYSLVKITKVQAGA